MTPAEQSMKAELEAINPRSFAHLHHIRQDSLRPRSIMHFIARTVILALTSGLVVAGAVAMLLNNAHAQTPSRIKIIDADTFDAGLSENVRLDGWDGPEKGKRAMCDRERELHDLAVVYADELIQGATSVSVIIKPGQRCGWNRYCGDILLDGRLYSEDMEAAGYLRAWPHKNGEALTDKPDWCE